MGEEIINKVAASALLTIDLEAYFPKEEIHILDIKPFLFLEQILKEKGFRDKLQNTDWTPYKNKIVGITCTVDAIIPVWAYMLIASFLQPYASDIIIGDEKEVCRHTVLKRINGIDGEKYKEKRVVIKGCGNLYIDAAAYLEITRKLLPFAKSIMYGEACSNVPVYKKK